MDMDAHGVEHVFFNDVHSNPYAIDKIEGMINIDQADTKASGLYLCDWFYYFHFKIPNGTSKIFHKNIIHITDTPHANRGLFL